MYIKNIVKIICREIKVMKGWFLIPPALFIFLMPFAVNQMLENANVDTVRTQFIVYSQMFIPIVTLIYPANILINALNDEGAELNSVYEQKKAKHIMIFFFINAAFLVPAYAICGYLIEISVYEFCKIAIMSFFVNAIIYAVSYLTKSGIAGFLGTAITYLLADIYLSKWKYSPFINDVINRKILLGRYLPYLGVGVIIMIIGYIANRKKNWKSKWK